MAIWIFWFVIQYLQEIISEDITLEEKKDKEELDILTENKGTLQEMMTLLRNWVFMMFAISNFLTSLGYPIPYSFVPVS